MSVEAFLDTNILVYSFDKGVPEKMEEARNLSRADQYNWCISWQVVQEFCAVALHRFATPLNVSDLTEYLELVLTPHCVVHSTPGLYQQALKIHDHTQYRFYDSLIVAAAIHAGASRLYSEDLQHGRKIGDLEIVNPF